MRLPEVSLWIACVDEAVVAAKRLARGLPCDTPSRVPWRYERQIRREVISLREWMASTEVGGLLWIASITDVCVGVSTLDVAATIKAIETCIAKSERIVAIRVTRIRRARIHARKATTPVPSSPMPRQDKGDARLLPRPRGAGKGANRVVGQRQRRAQVARAAGEDPSQGRLALSL